MEQFPNNDIQHSTSLTPQPQTLNRNEQSHPKLYPVKREENNMDNDFGYDRVLAENSKPKLN